jgi:hypothetical protein
MTLARWFGALLVLAIVAFAARVGWDLLRHAFRKHEADRWP